MTASLFGVTSLLVTLAADGNAPVFFTKKIKKFRELPLPSLCLAVIGIIGSIVTALLLPGKIYEYITTAAGILLLYNWAFIILSAFKVLKIKAGAKVAAWCGLLLIVFAVSGTLVEKEIRPGFFISLLFVILIALATLFMKFRVWNRNKAMSDKLRKSNLD